MSPPKNMRILEKPTPEEVQEAVDQAHEDAPDTPDPTPAPDPTPTPPPTKKQSLGRTPTVDYDRPAKVFVSLPEEVAYLLKKTVLEKTRSGERIDNSLVVENALKDWFTKEGIK